MGMIRHRHIRRNTDFPALLGVLLRYPEMLQVMVQQLAGTDMFSRAEPQ
jgi:hypothetical protein